MQQDSINIIKDHFGDLLPTSSMAEKLINGLEERQRETLKDLPKYGRTTLYVALGILLFGLAIQIFNGSIPNDQLQLFKSLKSPTIGGILSLFFTVVAYAVNAIFAVLAVSFIPYLTLKAYKVSMTRLNTKLRLVSRPSRKSTALSAIISPMISKILSKCVLLAKALHNGKDSASFRCSGAMRWLCAHAASARTK